MTPETVTTRGGFTQETLKLMQSLVDAWSHHPFFVQMARQIANYANARTPSQEAAAVWSWVKSWVTFRQDPVGAEWVQDPWETAVKSRTGDCDDIAVLVGTLLQAIGHPALMIAIRWKGRDEYSHASVLDQLAGAVVDAMPTSAKFNDPALKARFQSVLVAR